MKLPILLAALGLFARTATAAESAPFLQADLMPLGVYYYPEAWPTNRWAT